MLSSNIGSVNKKNSRLIPVRNQTGVSYAPENRQLTVDKWFSSLSLLSQDFLAFLADRCIPKTRKGLDYYLDAVGVPEYDPVLLVEKTQGRMAEDHKWLEII